MYLTKPKVLDLIDMVEKRFWKFDTLEHEEDKKNYKQMSISLRNNCRFLVAIYQLALFGYLAPFFSAKQKLVFDCYRPPWLHYYVILFLEEYSCIFTIFLPINVTDFLFLSLSTLTTIQFKLLNEEFRRIYSVRQRSRNEKISWTVQLRKCIEHHNFLLK